MPQHSCALDIGLFQRRWSGRVALKHKALPSLYLNELCYLHCDGPPLFESRRRRGEMRFWDQIDPGSGALRSWQAESERLVFDLRGRRRTRHGAHATVHSGWGFRLWWASLALVAACKAVTQNTQCKWPLREGERKRQVPSNHVTAYIYRLWVCLRTTCLCSTNWLT